LTAGAACRKDARQAARPADRRDASRSIDLDARRLKVDHTAGPTAARRARLRVTTSVQAVADERVAPGATIGKELTANDDRGR
jgi:hypothetical protein